MRLIADAVRPTPETNIAYDDELLEGGSEALRLWESPVPVVVVSRSAKVDDEVNRRACDEEGVPIVRRSSGGGTVLLGPGCLNYSLILSLDQRPELLNVAGSYDIVLGAVIRALEVPGLRSQGSDLALGGRKVSGNAQRRTRGWLLHHGTLLYRPDLNLVTRVLREPKRRPAYRAGRTHDEFLAALPLTGDELRRRMTTLAAGATLWFDDASVR